jgi:ketosteroid isomerase-like protein
MAEPPLEIVRRFKEAYDGTDIIPTLRGLLARHGPDPTRDEILAVWAEDPSWRHAHPEIEVDTSGLGVAGRALRGPNDIWSWWHDWTEAWQTYVTRAVDYREIGDAVMSASDIDATGPDGIPVRMRVFLIWTVRDGKVASSRAFLSEADAIAAASK